MHADIRLVPTLLILQGELLPDQRQHRGIGEMEQGDAGGKDEKRTAGEQNRQSRWPVVSFSVLLGDGIVQAARKVVVDRASGESQSTLNKLASDIAASR